VQRLRDALSKT